MKRLVVVRLNGKVIAILENFYSSEDELFLNAAKATLICHPCEAVRKWADREMKRTAGCHVGQHGDLGITVEHGKQGSVAYCRNDPDHRAAGFSDWVGYYRP